MKPDTTLNQLHELLRQLKKSVDNNNLYQLDNFNLLLKSFHKKIQEDIKNYKDKKILNDINNIIKDITNNMSAKMKDYQSELNRINSTLMKFRNNDIECNNIDIDV